MLEPTKPGFTGTVWESQSPEQLARDLVTGAGAVPAAEAGLAWARLSAGFAAAALDYERILTVLDSAWESKHSGPFIERIRALRDWLAASASAAAGNATQAETHAAAYELAKLTMPDVDEVEKLKDMQQLMQNLGLAFGLPLLGGLAATETDAEQAKAAAARVMRTYEAATENLSKPWEHEAPPQITSAPQPADQAQPTQPAETTPTPEPGSIPALSLGSIEMPPMPFMQLRAPGIETSENTTTQRVVSQPVTVQQMGTSMAPTAMGGTAGQIEDEAHTPRAGLVGAPGSDAELGLTSGMQVAPAVLGGLDPNVQRVPDIAFNASTTAAESSSGTAESGTPTEVAS